MINGLQRGFDTLPLALVMCKPKLLVKRIMLIVSVQGIVYYHWVQWKHFQPLSPHFWLLEYLLLSCFVTKRTILFKAAVTLIASISPLNHLVLTLTVCGEQVNSINTFCETEGWTVIQRRLDGCENFDRPWRDYENGFGKIDKEFWYSLKAMNCLTQTGQWELRVDFEFLNSTRSYLHYDTFKVGCKWRIQTDHLWIHWHNPYWSLHLKSSFEWQKIHHICNDNDAISTTNCTARIRTNLRMVVQQLLVHQSYNAKHYPKERAFMYFVGICTYNPRWVKIRPQNCSSHVQHDT